MMKISDDDKERAMEAVSEVLGDAYFCTRVWAAWSYRTMSENDFTPVNDSASTLAEIVDAVLMSIKPDSSN